MKSICTNNFDSYCGYHYKIDFKLDEQGLNKCPKQKKKHVVIFSTVADIITEFGAKFQIQLFDKV